MMKDTIGSKRFLVMAAGLMVAAMVAAGAGCVAQPEGGGDDSGDSSGPVCGDKTCEAGETATSCAADCGPVCGDKTCETGETAASCAADCGPTAVCGNNTCEAGETVASCEQDCTASVRMQNSSSYYIDQLFVRRCASSDWSTDLISSSVSPGSSFLLYAIPPDCYFLYARSTSTGVYWQTPQGIVLSPGQRYLWTLGN